MRTIKAFVIQLILPIILLISIFSATAQHRTVIYGNIYTEDFTHIPIQKFNTLEIEQQFEYYPINNNSFKILIDITKLKIIRVFNNDILLSPEDSIEINIYKGHPDLNLKGINQKLITSQYRMDSIGGVFFQSQKDTFHAKNYIYAVEQKMENIFNDLQNQKPTEIQKILLQKYFSSKKLFFLSLPFIVKGIPHDEIEKLTQSFFEIINNTNNAFYENEIFDLAIDIFFVSGIYAQTKSVTAITKLPEWGTMNDTLKRIIAVSFIKELAYNKIVLNKEDLKLIQQILCDDKANAIDNFCEYYHLKVDYSNLPLSDIFKDDYFVDINEKKTSAVSFFKDKDVYIDLWASWCGPCIEFIKELDMRKFASPHDPQIIFVSVDSDIKAWRNKSFNLNIPDSINYLINNGLNSSLAETLRINHVPYIIHIKNNKVDILNASKSKFSSLFKE